MAVCAITAAKSGLELPVTALSPGHQTRYELRYTAFLSETSTGSRQEEASKPSSSVVPKIVRLEEIHGSQDKIPGFVHRLGHALQEWFARRGRFPFARQLADHRGHQRPGSGR